MPEWWTKEKILRWIETSDTAVGKCLVKLYEQQTIEEQDSYNTFELNGMGFNAVDADYGTVLAKWYKARGYLTSKQIEKGRLMLRKYAAQLAKIANRINGYEY